VMGSSRCKSKKSPSTVENYYDEFPNSAALTSKPAEGPSSPNRSSGRFPSDPPRRRWQYHFPYHLHPSPPHPHCQLQRIPDSHRSVYNYAPVCIIILFDS
jgi:hypothetical protein